jgi:hypothetical protein
MTWTDSGLTRNTLLSEKLNKAMLLVQECTVDDGSRYAVLAVRGEMEWGGENCVCLI